LVFARTRTTACACCFVCVEVEGSWHHVFSLLACNLQDLQIPMKYAISSPNSTTA
jgi:hypothetical protein